MPKYCQGVAAHSSATTLGNNRKAMVRSVEDRLKRLRTDRMDIYLPHFDDGITQVEEIARGFCDFVRAGKMICTGF